MRRPTHAKILRRMTCDLGQSGPSSSSPLPTPLPYFVLAGGAGSGVLLKKVNMRIFQASPSRR